MSSVLTPNGPKLVSELLSGDTIYTPYGLDEIVSNSLSQRHSIYEVSCFATPKMEVPSICKFLCILKNSDTPTFVSSNELTSEHYISIPWNDEGSIATHGIIKTILQHPNKENLLRCGFHDWSKESVTLLLQNMRAIPSEIEHDIYHVSRRCGILICNRDNQDYITRNDRVYVRVLQ